MSTVVDFVLNLQSNLAGGLARAGASVRTFVAQTGSAQGAVNGLGSSLSSLAGLAAGAFAVKNLYDFGKSIVSLGTDMEETRIRYEVFTGSVAAANEQLAAISTLATKTPFEKKDLLEVGAMLEVAGVHGKETIDVITKLGNIAAATGADLKTLTTEIYTKNRGNELIRGSDLNQFAAYNISVADFAKSIGKSRKELYGMAKDGTLSFQILDKYLDTLGGAGGRYGSMMDKLSGTVKGKFSNLKDNISQLLSDLGEGEIPVMGQLLDGANNLLAWVKDNKAEFGKLFEPFERAGEILVEQLRKIGVAFGLTGNATQDLNGMMRRLQTTTEFVADVFTGLLEAAVSVKDSFVEIYDAVDSFYQLFNDKSIGVSLVGGVRELAADILKIAHGIANTTELLVHTASVAKQYATSTKWGQISEDDQAWTASFNQKIKSQDADDAALRTGSLTQKEMDAFFAKNKQAADDAMRSGSWGETPQERKARQDKGSAAKKAEKLTDKVGNVAGTKPTTINLHMDKVIGQMVTTQHNNNFKESQREISDALTQTIVAAIADSQRLANSN